MAREVAWLASALDDLEAACMFIGRQSPAYAAVLAAQVLKAAQSLDAFPERGRVVPELEQASVREVFVHRYRLIYRVEPERIAVLALVHGARDFHRAWRSTPRGD